MFDSVINKINSFVWWRVGPSNHQRRRLRFKAKRFWKLTKDQILKEMGEPEVSIDKTYGGIEFKWIVDNIQTRIRIEGSQQHVGVEGWMYTIYYDLKDLQRPARQHERIGFDDWGIKKAVRLMLEQKRVADLSSLKLMKFVHYQNFEIGQSYNFGGDLVLIEEQIFGGYIGSCGDSKYHILYV